MPREKVNIFIRYELNDKPVEEWNGLDISRIQSAFNVSYETVLFRLKSLKIIDFNLLDKLKVDKLENTATKLLNAVKGNLDLCKSTNVKKVPVKYLEWVISNYNEKLIPINSLESVLKYIDINVDDLELPSHITEDDESFDDLLGRMK